MATVEIDLKEFHNYIMEGLDVSIPHHTRVNVGMASKTEDLYGLFHSEDFSGDIAAGSTINSAKLYLHCGGFYGETDGTWYVYRVVAYGGEPDATPYYYTNNNSNLYEASWNDRHHRDGYDIPWDTAGCLYYMSDYDTSATGASEDNPLSAPVQGEWWDGGSGGVEVTGAMQQALDNCGGIIAFKVEGVTVLGEGEEAYCELGHQVGTRLAYIDVDYTPPAGEAFVPRVMIF